jgi:hypothetical protein
MADEDRYLTGAGELVPEQRSASYSTNTNLGPFSGGAILSGQDEAVPMYGGRLTAQLPEGLSATLSRMGQAGETGAHARDAIQLAKQLAAGQLALEASRVGSEGLPSYALQYSQPIGRQGGAPAYYPQPKGSLFIEAGGTPHTPERHVRGGARFNFADGGHVDTALHLLRQHFDEGGFLESLRGMFSGPDYLSTGEVASPTNWGDPERASDFFKADKAMRLAREVQGADDIPGSIPVRAPLTAPRPGPVEVQELPVNIPFAAPERGASLLSSDISPASVTSLPLAFAPEPEKNPARAAIEEATKLTARAPQEATGADSVWARMLRQESGNRQFDRNGNTITSPAGALGISQVMPSTGPEAAQLAGLPWSLERLRTDPEYNHALGRAYYEAQLERFGDPTLAAAAYNGGPGRVAGALRQARETGRPWTAFLRPETQNYVRIVTAQPRAHGGLVDDALHVVREHHADGEAVGQEMPAEEPRPLTIYRDNRPEAVEPPAETDADRVRAYKEMAAQVAQQSPEIQSMTHLGAKPTLPVTLDSGYAKGMELGRAPFDVAPGMSTLANTAYGAKTLPLYMNPVTALPAAASDFTESAMDKSLPGMAMSLLGVPGKVAKYGAGALMGAAGMEPGEAQAAKLPRVGGAVASIAHAAPKAADMSIEQALEIAKKYSGYQDPVANKIADWNWRPLPDVATELNMTQIPPHVQAFGDYMVDMANKAGGQGLSARDMLKGYTTTRASIQRRATDADNLRRLGLDLPSDVQTIRPEGAWMEWLGTPMGQRFLDEAAKGNISEDTIANAVKIMAPFGRHETDIPDAMRWAAKNIPGREAAASDLVHRAAQGASTPEEWRNFTSDIRGVGPSKSGFLASLYGRGDQPTLDARQIILNTGEPTKLAAPFIARSGGQGGVEAVNRLAARQAALALEAPSKYDPFYQHLAHHAIWDKKAGEMTTHGDIIKGMRNYAEGGSVEDRALMLVSKQA